MIAARGFDGKKVMVFGLARTGLSAARALLRGGAQVYAWDDAPARRQQAADGIGGLRLTPPETAGWRDMAALVLSPGVPLTHPQPHAVVTAARAHGCEVIGDIELFVRARRAGFAQTRLVLVTGTNGKSTTTALIGHLADKAGYQVRTGGNTGDAALGLDELGPDGVYVLEVSSYQLELTCESGASAAVLLNITPDHVDRHGGMAGYVAAKQRIFNGLEKQGAAIIGVDDEYGAKICAGLSARGVRVIPVSVEARRDAGVFVSDGQLYDALGGAPRMIAGLRSYSCLPGAHNWQNIAAAYATALGLGISEQAIVAGIASFPGLAHRMENVGSKGRVRFINDSKATNAEATAKALACHEGAYLILGGVPKAGGIEALRPLFSRIRKAYLIGEAAGGFAKTLDGAVAYEECGDLARAARSALLDAQRPGIDAVVLLSPACASFDQFENFEARGDAFRRIAADLRAECAP